MKKQILDFLRLLFDFDTETQDFLLADNEYIRIFANNAKDVTITKNFYIKSVSEIERILCKYKHTFNLYIGLSTTTGENGTQECMKYRRVLFLDLDKKDYKDLKDITDFTKHIKAVLPDLFYHCIVDSGNGYHVYYGIRRSRNNKRIAQINKGLAKLVEADCKATLPTQLARLPGSLNLKHDSSRPVNVVINNFGSQKFKAYTLDQVERSIRFANKSKKEKLPEAIPSKEYSFQSSYYCVEKMLSEGVIKGERNFCLGRITKYLQLIKGYTQTAALQRVLEWNRKCDPPKKESEIERDFERYWIGQYKLLGCSIKEPTLQSILNKYCNKFDCKSIVEDSNSGETEAIEFMMDNHLLKDEIFHKLRGNHYLMLSILEVSGKGLTFQHIEKEITNRKTGKCCLSKNTIRTALKDLISMKLVCKDENGSYHSVDISNYGLGCTRLYYSGAILLINGVITQPEYLLYICLAHHMQHNMNVTYDSLALSTGIDKGNISRYMYGLMESGLLVIEKEYSSKGQLRNVYKLRV